MYEYEKIIKYVGDSLTEIQKRFVELDYYKNSIYQLKQIDVEIGQKKAELEQLKTEIATANSELDQTRTSIYDAQKTFENLQSDIGNAGIQLNQLNDEIAAKQTEASS